MALASLAMEPGPVPRVAGPWVRPWSMPTAKAPCVEYNSYFSSYLGNETEIVKSGSKYGRQK
jgi:hypothetical protein